MMISYSINRSCRYSILFWLSLVGEIGIHWLGRVSCFIPAVYTDLISIHCDSLGCPLRALRATVEPRVRVRDGPLENL